MANVFKVITRDTMSATANTDEILYTVQGSKTLVILGMLIANVHPSQVTATVRLVSDTGSRGGSNNVTNGTSIIIKDAPIPVGSSLELMAGNKVVLETTDQITIDCSVADKLSGTLSIMEIT